MKKVFVLIVACWMGAVSAFSTNPTNSTEFQDYHPHYGINFQVFYDNLSPFGDWVSYPGYGYVWVPAVDAGFSPYMTDGHWVYTDEGWLWDSDYRWGWAPFHYGSWLYDNYYGWMWVPGYDWAPAWVTWGFYDDYYGWAPMMPDVYYYNYRPAVRYWHFVPARYLGDRYVYRYALDRDRCDRYVTHVTYINNYRHDRGRSEYSSGPDVDHVRRYGNFTPKPVRITEREEAGTPQMRNDDIAVYRPAVERDNRSYKPQTVTPRENVKPNTTRTNAGVTRDVRPSPAESPREFKSQPRQQKTVDETPQPTRSRTSTPQMDSRTQRAQRDDTPNTRSNHEATIQRDNRPVRETRTQTRQQAQPQRSDPAPAYRSTPEQRSSGEMNPARLQTRQNQPERSQPVRVQESRPAQRGH